MRITQLFALLFLLITGPPVRAEVDKPPVCYCLVLAEAAPIGNLDWNPRPACDRFALVNREKFPVAHLTGTFHRGGWRLYWEDREIPVRPDGTFDIRVLGVSKAVNGTVTVRGPSGEEEKEVVQVGFARWGSQGRVPASIAEQMEARGRRQTDVRRNLLSASLDGGTNYFFPSLFYLRKVAPHFGLDLQVSSMAFSANGLSSLVIAGYSDLNFFSASDSFRGLWLRAGGGIFRIALSSQSNQQETVWSPAARATAGWRWLIARNVQLGASAGAQYLMTRTGKYFVIDLSGLLPLFTVDASWIF